MTFVSLCSCIVAFLTWFTLYQDYVHGHHSLEDSLRIARNVLGAHLPDGRFLSDVEVRLEVRIIPADAYTVSPSSIFVF
jgi:hypothetical protein